MTTDAMKDSIAHIVRVAARDGAAIGPERLLAYLPSTSVDDAIADLDRAITAHVEAEVAQRLAAAPGVDPTKAWGYPDCLVELRRARPTPDEARSIGRVAEHLRGLAADRVAALIEERPGPTEAMRALFAERRPCAGWVATEIGSLVLRRSDGVGSHAVVHGQVWRTATSCGSAPTIEAAQLAAEDALRAVAAEILRAVGA